MFVGLLSSGSVATKSLWWWNQVSCPFSALRAEGFCRNKPAVIEWICFVGMIVLGISNHILCILMRGDATLYVKWTHDLCPGKSYLKCNWNTNWCISFVLFWGLFLIRLHCGWVDWSPFLSGPRPRRAELVCGVSVKRFPLIHFICSATSKPFVHTAPVPRWPSPSKHREWRCKTQTVKKKPSGQRKRWRGAEGGGRHAGQSKWQTAVKSVLWAPTYMWSRMTCELSQLPLVFR